MELAIPHLRILDYDKAVSFHVGASDGLKRKGISFERELRAQPWGSRDFVVHDPFDNTIVVTSAES